MKAKYKHTNIIARDWQRLAKFVCDYILWGSGVCLTLGVPVALP